MLLAHTASAASSSADWVQVVRATDAGLELILRAPELERQGDRVRVPGFDAGGEPGMPVVYECATTLGVPGPAGVELEVVNQVRATLNGVDAPRVPLRSNETLDEFAWASVQPPALAAAYPTNTVEVTGTAILRGRHVVVLRFHPLQYEPGGRATLTREAHVRLVFRDAPATGMRPIRPDPVHAALLNAAAAARWPLTAGPPRNGVRPTLPDERLRIRIAQRGVYALRGAELLAAGVPIDSPGFDPRTLRLYFDTWHSATLLADSTPASWQPDYEMREAAIWVPGEEDGAFDPLDDRIVFYALGPEGYENFADPTLTDSLAHFQHPYDRNQYAWLVWGGAFGRRMQSGSAAAPEPLTDPLVTRVRHREHLEENRSYARVDDFWYWERISFNPRSVTFDLDLAGELSAIADVRMTLGVSESFYQRIAADFTLNGQPLERIRWQQPLSMVYATVLQDVQLASQNELGFNIANDETPSVAALFLELDATWERPLAARADGSLEWSSRPTTDREVYELTGFATEPMILDVIDAFDPVRLLDPTPVAASVWHVRAGRGAGTRTQHLAITAPDTLDPVTDLDLRVVPSLRSRATSPDVLIVTHESTRAAAERLAAHRAARFPGGGVADVLVTTTRDIYDNFSGGRLDPLAIRNYVKFLYNLEQPEPRLQYVVLFGDATLDPRQILAGTPATLVPALSARRRPVDVRRLCHRRGLVRRDGHAAQWRPFAGRRDDLSRRRSCGRATSGGRCCSRRSTRGSHRGLRNHDRIRTLARADAFRRGR